MVGEAAHRSAYSNVQNWRVVTDERIARRSLSASSQGGGSPPSFYVYAANADVRTNVALYIHHTFQGQSSRTFTSSTTRAHAQLGAARCRQSFATRQRLRLKTLVAITHPGHQGRSKPPLATENLLENTDGIPRSLWSTPSEHPRVVLSGRQPATFYLC